ncbi:MAG: hypothetical protein IJ448_00660 [Oscillospiraceae bacterium]|nr:hypothetical protein [Oscillospiraceae bacterium]
MNKRYREVLRQLTEEPSEEERYIRELEEKTLRLEPLVQDILESLPDNQRTILEGYIYAQAELELYAVVLTFKNGKRLGNS